MMYDICQRVGGANMWVFGVLIAALVLLFVILIAQSAARTERTRHEKEGHDDAMDILKERYARGEVGDEEFEEKRKRLQK